MKWMPHGAHGVVHGHLYERHAVEALGRGGILHVEHQHHHGRAGADDERVDVDRQALHEALLDRVGNAGGGGGVRSRAHARLVGVQTALDAEHDHRAGEAAEDGLEVEGALEHQAEHGGQPGDVGDGGPQRDGDIGDSHDRHDDGRDHADALGAAEMTPAVNTTRAQTGCHGHAVGGVVGACSTQARCKR